MTAAKFFLPFLLCLAGLPSRSMAVDGTFDTDFGNGGRVVFSGDYLNPGFSSVSFRTVIESNGNLLVAGAVWTADMHAVPWFGEFRPDGTPVPTFGMSNGSGLVTGCWLSMLLCSGTQVGGRVVQDDGRIVFVNDTVIARTEPGAHALDTAGVFGGTGVASVTGYINNVQGQLQQGLALASTADGKWLVAGRGKYSAAASNGAFGVVRLNPDLSLDTTFNAVTDANGVTFAGGQIVSFGTGTDAYLYNLVVLADGKILLQGGVADLANATHLGAMARLNADGTLDTTFGNNGEVRFAQCEFFASGFVRDRAGRFLTPCMGGNGQILRFDAEGNVDTAFGMAGIAYVTPPPGVCSLQMLFTHEAVDSAGRIVAVGVCSSNIDADGDGHIDAQKFVAVRLHGDDGSLDTNFGMGGFVFGQFANPSNGDGAHGIVFDRGGRPVIDGFTDPVMGATQQSTLARLNYDLIFTNDLETVPRGRLPGQ